MPLADAEAKGLPGALRSRAGLPGPRCRPPRPRRVPAVPATTLVCESLFGSASAGTGTGCWPAGAPEGHRAAQRAQPVLRRREPRADPAEHRRVPGADTEGEGGRSGSRWTATPTAPGSATRRAASSTTLTLCQPVHVVPLRGPRAAPAGREDGEHDLDGRSPRRAVQRARSTRCPSASSTSARRCRSTGAMMGGEELGGFGFAMHLPERDGIVADCSSSTSRRRRRRSRRNQSPELHGPGGAVLLSAPRPPPGPRGLLRRAAPDHGAPEGRGTEELGGVAVQRVVQLDTNDCTEILPSRTARGCCCGSPGPSRSCACTRRRATPRTSTRSSISARGWCEADGHQRDRYRRDDPRGGPPGHAQPRQGPAEAGARRMGDHPQGGARTAARLRPQHRRRRHGRLGHRRRPRRRAAPGRTRGAHDGAP